MSYDDAGWHYDTCIEHGLDVACAATHIGMFFAWLAHHGLIDASRVDIAPLLDRSVTPGVFLLRIGGEFRQSHLNARGEAFSEAAYNPYLATYRNIPEIAQHPVTYAAPDTWTTYEAVAPVIQEAYDAFSTQQQ